MIYRRPLLSLAVVSILVLGVAKVATAASISIAVAPLEPVYYGPPPVVYGAPAVVYTPPIYEGTYYSGHDGYYYHHHYYDHYHHYDDHDHYEHHGHHH